MPEGEDKESWGKYYVKIGTRTNGRPIRKEVRFGSGHNVSIDKHPFPFDPKTGNPVTGLSKIKSGETAEETQPPKKKEKVVDMPMGGVPTGDLD